MIKEETMDLFSLPEDEYYFVQCVSSDFKMGKGIALQFNKAFGCRAAMVESFKNYKWKNEGDCLLPKDKKVFHLITKNKYWDKPTYRTIKESLIKLKVMCAEQNIAKLAMPKIGCGLDNLLWNKVRSILEDVFKDSNIEIIVCDWSEE